ncbi:MAG TPA: hypothetical protein PKD55_05780 [Bellilinea sp.]|nr:hypothetical protein [Bellilinea sp.]
MDAEKLEITIGSIDTIPELDPYHRDTNQPSHTVIEFDPDARTVTVDQEYDSGSTTMDRWHNLVLASRISGWPDADELRRELEDPATLETLAEIAEGWERVWDGSNHVGRLTHDARMAWESLVEELSDAMSDGGWQFWSTEDYLYEWARERITATTTDAEIDAEIPAIEADAESDRIVISGDARDYLIERRNQLLSEMDDDLTIDEAVSLAAEHGRTITARAVRHAAKTGLIEGARKHGRDWLFEQGAFLKYAVVNPVKPGRKNDKE